MCIDNKNNYHVTILRWLYNNETVQCSTSAFKSIFNQCSVSAVRHCYYLGIYVTTIYIWDMSSRNVVENRHSARSHSSRMNNFQVVQLDANDRDFEVKLTSEEDVIEMSGIVDGHFNLKVGYQDC